MFRRKDKGLLVVYLKGYSLCVFRERDGGSGFISYIFRLQ